MNKRKRWDIYFRQHDCPCVITHLYSRNLLYCNDKFLKQFDITTKIEDLIGRNIDSIGMLSRIKLDKQLPPIEEFDYFETPAIDTLTGVKFHLRSVRSVDDDTIFCELLPVEDLYEHKFGRAMADCMEILQLPQEKVVISLMNLIRDFYNAHSSFIYRIDYPNSVIQCEFDLCSDPDFERLHFSIIQDNTKLIFDWFNQRDDINVIEANINKSNQDELSIQILKTFDLKNITLYIIEDKSKTPVAIIGLNEREIEFSNSGFIDYRLLKSVANFIWQGLGKADMENAMLNLQNVDDLTGFLNRITYSQKVDEIANNPPDTIGVISVNVNGLKRINEQLGYTKGDKHIRLASDKLKDFFEYEFYRVSGDEFIGIALDVSSAEFEEKVTSLQKTMRENKDYNFAFGFAFSERVCDFTKLLLEAETLMYINKQEYYASSDRNFDDVSDTILSNLLSYIENDEFMIYLQPQVKLKDSSIYGAEALVRRFDKANNKMVFPDQFIPLYEQKSVIRHVDIFVIETVCKLLSEWAKIGKAIPISVNLSRVTLQEYGIVETIVAICGKYNVPHGLLVIEVTERVGLVENNVASTLITQFKEEGFNISLDDFGCAYSNIITLAQIQVDEVKIDKSLVDDITTSKKNLVLVKNVLSMCNELDGAYTLAEGIEDEAQAKVLQELGCSLGQGYFYSRPIPVDEFAKSYII